MANKLQNIVNHYKHWRQNNPDTCLAFCKRQINLKEAIRIAALALNHKGKRHGHQRRIKKINLELFCENLIDKIQEIESSTSFADLYQIVESCCITGIGALTIYDTANRIGEKVGLYPDKIYLHAGTRTGIEKLLGMKVKGKTFDKKNLPKAFQDPNLSNADLEDILCIYNDKFFLFNEENNNKGCT